MKLYFAFADSTATMYVIVQLLNVHYIVFVYNLDINYNELSCL